MVLLGFTAAWRRASVPTRRSPLRVNATTEGVVRPPSALAMTVGSPPSMTATTLLVVPRSMPTVLAMGWDPPEVIECAPTREAACQPAPRRSLPDVPRRPPMLNAGAVRGRPVIPIAVGSDQGHEAAGTEILRLPAAAAHPHAGQLLALGPAVEGQHQTATLAQLAGQCHGQAGGGRPDGDRVEGGAGGGAATAVCGHHLDVHPEPLEALGCLAGQLRDPLHADHPGAAGRHHRRLVAAPGADVQSDLPRSQLEGLD